MRILLVHGRSQGGKDPLKLKAEWLECLEKGLKRAGLTLPQDTKVDFPFYGDQLDEFVRQFDLPADPAVAPKGSPVVDEYAEFRRQVAQEIASKYGVSDQQVNDELGEVAGPKGPANWSWVQALIRILDRNVTDMSATTIEVFLRDVFLYTRRDVVRRAIDKTVSADVFDDTAVIVGHSLGSVVAYSIMNARKNKVPAYVTVGSPLAIRAVRQILLPVSNPVGTRGWYNAFDPRDVVALYPLDAANFDVDPAITNFSGVKNWTENAHGIIGYLDDPHVARAIHAGLGT